MNDFVMKVEGVGKAYRVWSSQWLRAASWFGAPVRPREEHWILRNVSISIKSGETVGVVGRNGAGKSTLLKLITGTVQPTEGRIVRSGHIAAILELGMGFNPDLTGRQNAYHSAGLMGYSQQQIDSAMAGIEEFAEVGEYFDEPVRTYSSGMQVRVAFAVATAFRPDVLIVDEALSVGDAYFQAKCFKRVQAFKEQGTTLILVSHAVGDIVKHCDRVLFIKDGGVYADGPAREISNLYLDELFGRTSNAGLSPGHVSAEVMPDQGAEDVFHTRHGYNRGEHRWGQGGAKIIDYAVVSGGERFPARIESGAVTNFYMKVVFERDFDNVVPGFLLKTLEGLFLYGTNSFLSSDGREVIAPRAGDIVTCHFSLPMSVNEGHYMVSLGISSGDPLAELVPLDRRYDAILLDVSRPMQFWGIVDLKAEFSTDAA
ncbi:ABC transporter ATP-binding protein [Xanthomonas hortorum]|uniref:ABC transporter ATP-binding protein n=1 Tax=Xanthomonas hortorum pv. hederae TaxID=453603 RepID=A0A9X3YYL0_9XANT|nr:ABC transporter ATP-binding protein [Xanthomonas hortorum]MCE4369480.1 ABC transporter ATP-binding protein [Xanthomonas hortorum pv. hederae]MDC8636664.1 ABC transporter ATP-binding protein [Xanthomonas hortorum pv. hederae]PPU86099.1 ABC transporter ATP-binding protein [Xanthomonas hortorum pv. hederae]PUF01934.1 ABC transporter ATP-binding protein [Xanthomonas hortorum pv. hederae]